jgi:hypothetical protein
LDGNIRSRLHEKTTLRATKMGYAPILARQSIQAQDTEPVCHPA